MAIAGSGQPMLMPCQWILKAILLVMCAGVQIKFGSGSLQGTLSIGTFPPKERTNISGIFRFGFTGAGNAAKANVKGFYDPHVFPHLQQITISGAVQQEASIGNVKIRVTTVDLQGTVTEPDSEKPRIVISGSVNANAEFTSGLICSLDSLVHDNEIQNATLKFLEKGDFGHFSATFMVDPATAFGDCPHPVLPIASSTSETAWHGLVTFRLGLSSDSSFAGSGAVIYDRCNAGPLSPVWAVAMHGATSFELSKAHMNSATGWLQGFKVGNQILWDGSINATVATNPPFAKSSSLLARVDMRKNQLTKFESQLWYSNTTSTFGTVTIMGKVSLPLNTSCETLTGSGELMIEGMFGDLTQEGANCLLGVNFAYRHCGEHFDQKLNVSLFTPAVGAKKSPTGRSLAAVEPLSVQAQQVLKLHAANVTFKVHTSNLILEPKPPDFDNSNISLKGKGEMAYAVGMRACIHICWVCWTSRVLCFCVVFGWVC
jgi:hypothetical protein